MRDFVFKNGLVLGAIQVAMLFVSYLMGVDFMIQNWWGIFQILVSLGFVVYFSIEFRKLQGGYASFKESFSVVFGMYATAGFILTFFNIILYNFIDIELAQTVKEVLIQKTYEMMEGFGATDSTVDDIISELENQDSFSVGTLAKGYFYNLPLYIIGSLIIAAFIKRNKPDLEQ